MSNIAKAALDIQYTLCNSKNMHWLKIYFWFYLIYSLLALIGLIAIILHLTPTSSTALRFDLDIGECYLQLILLLGLFSFVYKKKLWAKKYWLIFFYMTVILWIFPEIVWSFGDINAQLTFSDIILNIFAGILDLPSFYAIYKLGKR